MKITAQNVKSGDIVRGIGLAVEYSEPQDDFNTSLVGQVSTRNAETGQFEQTPAVIQLPNEHLVNVRRSDENFRGDRLALVQVALADYASSGDTDALTAALGQVADMPRGAHVSWGEVFGLVVSVDVAELGAEDLLVKLDLLGKYSVVSVLSGEAHAAEFDTDDSEPTLVDNGYGSDVD